MLPSWVEYISGRGNNMGEMTSNKFRQKQAGDIVGILKHIKQEKNKIRFFSQKYFCGKLCKKWARAVKAEKSFMRLLHRSVER